MEEFVVTWPAAFAVVGSVATFAIALFGYLIKTHTTYDRRSPPEKDPPLTSLHARISEVKDRVNTLDADLRVLASQHETVEKQVTAHERRATKTNDSVASKLDHVMEILMKILSDEKL